MDREIIPIRKSYCTKWAQLDHPYFELSRLRRQKSDLEVAMRWNQGLLNCLEEALDELHFHNNSYKKGSTSPNFHVTLQHRVLHGNNINLATERELLKEMSTTRNQLPVDYDIKHDSTHFKQSLNEFIQLFYEERQSESRYKNFHKELKCIEEKTIVIACLKGRIWNPWASLATIKKYITIIKELSEEIEKENREIISEIEEAKMNKETESIRKKLLKLEHQLRDMRLEREEVHKCLLNLTQCHQEAVLYPFNY
ncbi:hypothetical protein ERO13_D04G139850v2 [Gossypium hirsutum]|nr:hypothetical protein ERO13_D04G139850v2 [Gossypium hirsutum]